MSAAAPDEVRFWNFPRHFEILPGESGTGTIDGTQGAEAAQFPPAASGHKAEADGDHAGSDQEHQVDGVGEPGLPGRRERGVVGVRSRR